jgi:hypothetical protein
MVSSVWLNFGMSAKKGVALCGCCKRTGVWNASEKFCPM